MDGARTRLTHPDGEFFDMAWQDNGALRAVHEGTTTDYRLGLFQYDVRNRLIEIEPNSAPGRTDHGFGYDAVSRVASVTNDLPASASDLTIGLGYNAASQIVTRTRSDADYVFDDPTPGATDYDSDGLNQYPTVDAPDSGLVTLTYDARGNFVRYNAPGADHERIYVYDALNRLVSARLAGESVAQATLFSYDPLGRLYAVTDQAIPANSRRYLWDGGTMIAQYDDTSATVQRRWVYAPGSLGAPMIQYWNAQVGEASRQYMSTDERGSVVSYSNPNGTVTPINTYDPYGMPGAGNDGSFQFTGQLWLPEAELYYMRNRMYDPALGRFAQTDPIGYAGGMNLYAYVGNDPANLADPWGLCPNGFVTGSRIQCHQDGHLRPGVSSVYGPAHGGNRATAARAGGATSEQMMRGQVSQYYGRTACVGFGSGPSDCAFRILGYLSDPFFSLENPFGGPTPRDFFEGPIERALRDAQASVRGVICAIPPIGVQVGLDWFGLIGGAGTSTGLSFNPGNGQFSWFGSNYAGQGFGGGPSVGAVINAPTGTFGAESFEQLSGSARYGGAVTRSNTGSYSLTVSAGSAGGNAAEGSTWSSSLNDGYDIGCRD